MASEWCTTAVCGKNGREQWDLMVTRRFRAHMNSGHDVGMSPQWQHRLASQFPTVSAVSADAAVDHAAILSVTHGERNLF